MFVVRDWHLRSIFVFVVIAVVLFLCFVMGGV